MADTMLLGDLIAALSKFPAEKEVHFDRWHVHPTTLRSYRGYYDQLALGWDRDGHMSVGALLIELRSAIGKSYEGWKGGTYWMDASTPVWADNPGDASGTCIVGIRETYGVVLITGTEDDA